MINKEKKLLLIDANSFIHRTFHALPPLKTAEGKPTGAIYGLTNTLLKILNDEKPDYVAAAFDTPQKTFRKEMFKEYKAQRPQAPEELKAQIIEAYTLFKNFGIKTIEKPGFEADDILGTLAKKFSKNKDIKTIILTGDLDALQLVENNITVLVPKKGISQMNRYDKEKVMERFGIKPQQLTDYKGLAGDSSDNIPGVPGIGPKTTQKLLSKYGTIEKLYQKIDNEKKDPVLEKITKNKEQAILSKKLATIKTDLALDVSLKNIEYSHENGKLIEYLKSLGFKSLVERLTPQKQKESLF